MRPHLTSLFAAALLALTGCIGGSTNPRVVGAYDNGPEAMIFLRDGQVKHRRVIEGRTEEFTLGSAYSSSASEDLRIVGPDTSRYIGTTFHFDSDYATVTVNWSDLRGSRDTWQVQYTRRPPVRY